MPLMFPDQALGFLATAPSSTLRLLPSPWPTNALPPPTSSLLSVASGKGVLAAAAPDCLIIAATEAVRLAFSSEGDSPKPFEPQIKIPLQTRISQVAFSADENALVISSQNGGGLAVYDVAGLAQGNTQPAIEISTNGLALRELVPNPTKEASYLFAAVTTSGQLLIADLRSQQLVSGPSGPVLKEGVTCVSWSAKGKALVAGLGDGTAYQLKPNGESMADIPAPPPPPAVDSRHGKNLSRENLYTD